MARRRRAGKCRISKADLSAICVVPAQAGIQGSRPNLSPWFPAFAGMTIR